MLSSLESMELSKISAFYFSYHSKASSLKFSNSKMNRIDHKYPWCYSSCSFFLLLFKEEVKHCGGFSFNR